uniref:Pectinesterase catalytic domain-containing protein n=1 Tax=Fagus sylvatica TaxID=28930 RepID=A0A2N9JA12_FAGSY
MTFRNTAVPETHQAVALRVDSDQSAFYRCSMEGHQDFIFGNGAAVLQNCKIFTRVPLPQQKVTITAQVQPRGWLEWYGDFALSTLWYGEYRKNGPGASLSEWVNWPGYHIIRDATAAAFFTIGRFFDGSSWLPNTGVKFTSGLSN